MSKQNNIPMIWDGPENAENCVVLAHGAGAPMDSEFMNFFAQRLAVANIRVLRFEFPYMALRREGHGGRPPNPRETLLTSWRQVIALCRKKHDGTLFIGGKSMGGRVASMIADECMVDGLVLLGYPFYAPGKQDKPRIDHLIGLKTPALVLQGERDTMGSKQTVETYSLSEQIKITWLEDGNHDLKPRKKSGIGEEDNRMKALSDILNFINSTNKNNS